MDDDLDFLDNEIKKAQLAAMQRSAAFVVPAEDRKIARDKGSSSFSIGRLLATLRAQT
jgi:hypothetical protein